MPKGLLKKIFNLAPGHEEESNQEVETSRYCPDTPVPTDEKFTHHFRKNGGKFVYCENLDEVHESFDNVLLENDWYERRAWCTDKVLQKGFDKYNLKFTEKADAAFMFCSCEALVADIGGILFSSNQIKEKKIHNLPGNMVVLAYTSQLVNTISEGLRVIKARGKSRIPSNITTIKNFSVKQKEEDNFMSYGSCTKNLYLLLLEDL